MIDIKSNFQHIIAQMMQNSSHQSVVTEENVWQEGNAANRKLFYKIIEELILPGSSIEGLENLIELLKLSKAGKACLLLVEHYSNFDLPCFFNLLENAGTEGTRVADALVAMAGYKLNEENTTVLAFTEAFSRIIIYPSRSIEALPDGPDKEAELKRAQRINLAAMRALSKAKTTGNLVLVFPAGTRYRPGKPETKRGVKEIDSYIKGFDHMVFVSINGNTLQVAAEGEMLGDLAQKDVIIYGVSPVVSCAEFRSQSQAQCPKGTDCKQFTVDKVMKELDVLHAKWEKVRQERLAKLR
jgi:glycerol-3-phosphate O-acyltransferase